MPRNTRLESPLLNIEVKMSMMGCLHLNWQQKLLRLTNTDEWSEGT